MSDELRSIANRIEKLDGRILLLILNALALGVFFFVAFRYNYMHPDNMGRLMFSTPDTKQYRAVADWLFGKSDQVPFATTLRPFLYPLLLGSVRQITDNPYVFWAVQFCLWLAAINLTAITVYRITNRKLLLYVSFLVMMINVSTIALTFYALAETLVIFLLSLWLFVLSRTNLRDPSLHDVFLLTFLLGLLTITKPIFQLHLMVFVAYVLARNFHPYKKSLVVALAVLPVVLQILINVNLNGILGISNITEYTVKWYLLPQVYQTRNNVSLDDARSAVKDYDTIRMVKYLIEDPVASSSVFFQNLGENMTGASDYISYYDKPYIFTRITSIVYLFVQILFLPMMIYLFLFWVRKVPLLLPIMLMYFFSFLIIFTSGISFNEGDRLVIGALPLWIVIYSSVPVLIFDRRQANTSAAPASL